MPSSGMLRRVALIRTDISQELSKVTKLQSDFVFLCSVHRLLVKANIPSSPILVTLMMETLSSSETSFLQEPHGVTSQKTAFFTDVNRWLYILHTNIDRSDGSQRGGRGDRIHLKFTDRS
jgi:hypothetical protein